MDHIDAMDELQKGIRLRAYGQQDPVIAYREEGFDMFDAMIDTIRENTARMTSDCAPEDAGSTEA